MRFMVMHKMTPELESGKADPEVVAAVGRLCEEGAKDGAVFVSKEVAMKWALRFGEITRVHEIEVRQFPEY
jgi:hypothetical protein